MNNAPFQIVTDYQWLYLDLNSYFASIEQQLRPELHGKPVAVVPLMSDYTCAIAASYEAKALGIKTNTPVHEAKRLCPDIHLVLARHEAYVDYHHRIMQEIERHLPIEKVESIDEASCRLMADQCDPVVAMALAQQIKDGIHSQIGEFIHCSVGIGPNRFLAKVATDLQKPDGLTIIRAATMQQQLCGLALRDLPGIGRSMAARLETAGIHSVAHLWSLPPKELRHLWGSVAGERFWYALHGIQLNELTTNRRTVGHSHVLAPELRPAAEAYIVAQRLLLKAASRLRRMGYESQAMSLAIRVEKGTRYQLEKRFHAASDSVSLKAILSEAWKTLLVQSGARRIKKISVTLHALVPQHAGQGDLFGDTPDAARTRRNESLSDAMDVLNEKFGRDTIVMGFLPQHSRGFSGTKIAFTRIPDAEEFYE